MSTTIIDPQTERPARIRQYVLRPAILAPGLVCFLSVLALGIHGYHPYAEDGGLYTAGIKRLLNPNLYVFSRPFVEAHLRFSIFAPMVAGFIRSSHMPLPWALLLIYLCSIAATLSGIWLLTQRCYSGIAAPIGAVTLATAWLTLPVAGTSLILMDPYVTARSISLPCSLFAMAAMLDFCREARGQFRLRPLLICGGMLILAGVTHPLMAAFAVGDVLLLATLLSRPAPFRLWGSVVLCGLAFVASGMLQVATVPDSTAYVRVAATRYYWFLSQWQWYEVIGIIAPLLIMGKLAFLSSDRATNLAHDPRAEARIGMSRMALGSGVTAVSIALAFAHESSASHLVARLQPLRALQLVYVVMIIMIGARLGTFFSRYALRGVAAFALIAVSMFYVQRLTYPSSAHIEWPIKPASNEWQQAFEWIRDDTPINSIFALDANYISLPGEDAQSFRAIAERSVLPDYSKDGGEASISPFLTSSWIEGQVAQDHLSDQTDGQRIRSLRPFNVSWVVIQQHAKTSFFCPYANRLVMVCRLP